MNSPYLITGPLLQASRIFTALFVTFLVTITVMAQTENALEDSCVNATRDVTAQFSGENRCPQANAGLDLPIQLSQPVPLDASGTVDLDGHELRFQWSVVEAPKGSAVAISDVTSVRTEFTPDLAGDYAFELRVTDKAGSVAQDHVIFSTNNTPPVAHSGEDRTVQVGQMVSLDAARSYDLDGDVLAYQWTLIEQPMGSSASLSSRSSDRSTLVPDSEGDYRIELKVSDDATSSAGAELVLSTHNSAPTASSGRTRTVGPNSTVIFDSSRSKDFDENALSYHWSLLSAPQGYDGTFDNASIDSPAITVGASGFYLIQLVVDDGMAVSNPVTTLIEVKRDRLANFDLNDYLPLVNRGGFTDTDGDGVEDAIDNCVLVANAPQRDTDGDGIGNYCDPDLNNDGIVNFIDITLWTPFFLGSDENADFNGDGVVNFLDYVIITDAFLQQPGPPGTIVWVSLVDGNFDDRTNWQPQIVPSAGSTAVIDVPPAVTVTQSGGNIEVENIVQNENLVLANTMIEVGGSLQLGGTLSLSTTTINNTSIVPSLAGTGSVSLMSGTHTWSGNTIGVPTVLNNGANINNANNLWVDDTITIASTFSPTGISFESDQTIFGNAGTIVLDGTTNGVISETRILPASGVTLTLGAGLTVRGANSVIGASNANLIVNGMVLSDVASRVLRVGGALWSGTGLLSTLNGSIIDMYGTLENGGGTLNLDTNGAGTINLTSGSSLRNGTITGPAGTNLTINTGSTNLEAMNFTVDVVMANGANSTVTEGLTVHSTLVIDAPFSPTGLIFPETQFIGGTGTIVFNGASNGIITEPRLLPEGAPTIVTFGEDLTIRGGKGTIGSSLSNIVLNADVNADVDGQAIQILRSSWNDASTITASNGGSILLSGEFEDVATLNLDTISGGTINVLANSSLRNGTVNGTAGTVLTINTGNTNLEAMIFNTDVTLQNGANSTVTEGMTINETLLIDAPFSSTGLLFPETQLLGGTGTIVFNGVANGIITEPRILPQGADTVLTIGSEITIRGGKGTIGSNASSVVITGPVNADLDGQAIQFLGANWDASSTITASNNGQILLAGDLDNIGTLNLDTMTGGVVNVLTNTSLRNGIINGTTGTNLTVNTGSTNLEAMVFNIDTTLVNGANSTVTGGLTLNSTLTIDAPFSPTGLLFPDTQLVSGSGTIVFNGAANGIITEPRLLPQGAATVVTFGPDITIRGGKGTIGAANSKVNILSTVISDVAGQSIRLTGENWVSTGSINAINGANIQLAGTFDNANQPIDFNATDGSINVLTGANLRNVIINGTTDTRFDFDQNGATLDNVTMNADISTANGTLTDVSNGLTLNGTLTINAPFSPTSLRFTDTQTLGGNATVVFNSALNPIISEATITMTGPVGMTLTIGPNVLIRGGTGTIGSANRNLIIDGTISADTGNMRLVGQSVTNNGLLEALDGRTLILDTLTSSPGDLHAGPDSVLQFADPIGGLSAASDIMLDIGPSEVPGSISALSTTNALDGTLTISAVNGYSPLVGNGFTIIQQSGAATGVFSSVISNGLGAGESFSIGYATQVTATVSN